MKIVQTMLAAVTPTALMAATALMMAGCADSTTHKDVADARQKLEDARQETRDAVREGQQDLAAAQRDIRDHLVNKPVTPDDAADARRDLADARQEVHEKVADAKDNERAAANELKATEQRFAATKERDAFVNQAEQSLANYDKRIEELNSQASAAEGAAKDAIERQIDAVEAQRDRAASALSELKNADLATWKTHQDHVRMAFQELENSMKNVR